VAAAIDPIGALASSVASFALDYLPPLVQMMNVIAGDPAQVTAIAQTWSNISKQVAHCKSELDAAVDRVTQGWSGSAAAAYRTMGHSFEEVLVQLSETCAAVSHGFTMASAIVAVIHDIVKQLISALVGSIISAAVEELATAGLGTPGVIAQLIAKIAKYALKAKKWMDELLKSIKAFETAVKAIDKAVESTLPILKKIPGVSSPEGDLSGVGVVGFGLGTIGLGLNTATNASQKFRPATS